jgi:outer membrane protein insertion porin family
MRQMEGGWASTYLIDQSKVRLERLGYFKEVNVETPQVPGTDDQVDVNYSVEEQPSGSITASVGFAQNAGLILGGSISQNNFLGTGNKVSVGLTRSEYQTRYSFGFVDPYWTVDGVSLGYNAFYRTTDYDDLDVDVSSYAVDSYGAGMSIGYPISETSRLTYGLTIQQDSIDTGDYTVDEIINFMEQEGDSYLNLKASIGWSESTLNRGVLANRGHSQSLVLESTVPGSDLSFFKIDYRGQVFTPLNDKYTLRFHTELGFGDAYGSTSELPFYEHYFAGGFNSVRGFEDSSLGPRSTPSVVRNSKNEIVYGVQDKYGRYTDPDQDPLPFGGNVLVQGGAELLFPLPFVKDQRSLRTALFWDVGNVYDTSCSSSSPSCNNIDFGDLASSVGVGVTWVTAMGPLSFSLAAPIKKPEEADTQIFQFSLGQTF